MNHNVSQEVKEMYALCQLGQFSLVLRLKKMVGLSVTLGEFSPLVLRQEIVIWPCVRIFHTK